MRARAYGKFWEAGSEKENSDTHALNSNGEKELQHSGRCKSITDMPALLILIMCTLNNRLTVSK